jgi:hypothetical protein
VHILYKFSETRKRTERLLSREWLSVNEELADRKIITSVTVLLVL